MSGIAEHDPHGFVRRQTAPMRPPLVPEIALYLATDILPLWQMTETELAARGLPPPYWAFAWAGGQALARHLFDHPQLVAGKSVLDLGAGSGLAAIAAARCGAKDVTASDIDRFACAAIRLNAALNRVAIGVAARDLIGEPVEAELILVGDMCYEKPLAARLCRWLAMLVQAGKEVLVGDPGRSYFPRGCMQELARYEVPTTRALEDSELRSTGVFRLRAVEP